MSVSWIYEFHCVAFLRKDTMWDEACMRGPVITFCKHSTPSKRYFVTYCKLKLCNMILMNVIRIILFVVQEVTFSFALMKYQRCLKMTPWYAYIGGCVYYGLIMLYYSLITFWSSNERWSNLCIILCSFLLIQYRYTLFWFIIGTCKFAFSYFLQVFFHFDLLNIPSFGGALRCWW